MTIEGLSRYEVLAILGELSDTLMAENNGEQNVVLGYDKITPYINRPIANNSSTLDYTKKKTYLQHLDTEGIIDLITPETEQYFELVVIENEKLLNLYRDAHVRAMHNDGEPARITYNPASGKGIANGKAFKLKGKPKRFFTLLFVSMNSKVSKREVCRVLGLDTHPSNHTNTVIELNNATTNLRRSLRTVNKYQLRHNNDFELWAYKPNRLN